MANRYRFEITANGFRLHLFYSDTEKVGLERGGEYMREFQKRVANITLKIAIYDRGVPKYRSSYGKDQNFIKLKTLVKKPLALKRPAPTDESI